MKWLLLCVVWLWMIVALPKARSEESAAESAVGSFEKTLIDYGGDWPPIKAAMKSSDAQDDVSWFEAENMQIVARLQIFFNDLGIWGLLDDSTRLRTLALFESSRKMIAGDVEMSLARTGIHITPLNHSAIYAAQAVQNREEYRKIHDWLAAFRFRVTDEHFVQVKKP